MIALEIETPIVNHRIDISSDLLPAHVARAKLIVMYKEETAADQTARQEALAYLATVCIDWEGKPIANRDALYDEARG